MNSCITAFQNKNNLPEYVVGEIYLYVFDSKSIMIDQIKHDFDKISDPYTIHNILYGILQWIKIKQHFIDPNYTTSKHSPYVELIRQRYKVNKLYITEIDSLTDITEDQKRQIEQWIFEHV